MGAGDGMEMREEGLLSQADAYEEDDEGEKTPACAEAFGAEEDAGWDGAFGVLIGHGCSGESIRA